VPADVHHFEDFELDPSAYRLSRNGDVIRLERIPLKLLCLLVERRGEIVTRGEILEHIWGKGVFIDSESAINTAVRKIRRALGDDPDAPRFIVTIPAKGYRFIAQVEVSNGELKDIPNIEPTSDGGAPYISDAAEPALPSSANTPGEPIRSNFWLTVLLPQSRLVPIAGVIIAVASIALPHLWQKAPHTPALVSSPKGPCRLMATMPSIAVLPFTNVSGDPQQGYFSDGISNQLIEDLSHLPGLFVIARNSSFAYKGKSMKEPEIGQELRVRYLLEGDILKAGDRVRIGVELVEASSAREVWTQRFDRPLRDIFSLQDEIVTKVVTTLGLLLRLDQTREPIFRNFQMTNNLEAFDNYLRAREYNLRLTKEDNAKGRYWAKKATELDPRFAEAYALLAWTYFNDAWDQWDSNYLSDFSSARELAEKALALDDSAGDALALITELDWLQGRFDQAVADGKRAVSINPNYAFGYQSLADALSNDARPEDAANAVERAMCLDPAGYNFYAYQLGTSYVQRGRYAEALPILKEHLSESPNSLVGLIALVVAYTELGRDREARDGAAEIMRISPHYTLPATNSAWYNQPGTIGAWHRRVIDDLHKAGLK
jgi:TolB-like protein/DNA-binding winged helix-turn-helix (wHTH) protein